MCIRDHKVEQKFVSFNEYESRAIVVFVGSSDALCRSQSQRRTDHVLLCPTDVAAEQPDISQMTLQVLVIPVQLKFDVISFRLTMTEANWAEKWSQRVSNGVDSR